MSFAFDGIIPANTGRIPRNAESRHTCADHPREYGENFYTAAPSHAVKGSSPRIRGEFATPAARVVGVGIIPANTGRIVRSVTKVAANGDHPREYGENELDLESIADVVGSSPRIRGEYCSPSKLRGAIGDHPREYGENPCGPW